MCQRGQPTQSRPRSSRPYNPVAVARYAPVALVATLLVATAAAFVYAETLKLTPSPILGTHVTKVFSPALGSAEISFRLRKTGTVQVSIVDAGGDVVRTVADRPYEKGRVTVAWDGRDDAGNVVPEGLLQAARPPERGPAYDRAAEPDPRGRDRADGRELRRSAPSSSRRTATGGRTGSSSRYTLDEPRAGMLLVNGETARARRGSPAHEDELDWYGIAGRRALRTRCLRAPARARADPRRERRPRHAAPSLCASATSSCRTAPFGPSPAARFRVRVDTDARAIRWRFAGAPESSELGLLALRAPAAPGEYTLYASVGSHAARTTVAWSRVAELARLGGALGCAGLALLLVSARRDLRLAGLAAWTVGAALLAAYLAPAGLGLELAGGRGRRPRARRIRRGRPAAVAVGARLRHARMRSGADSCHDRIRGGQPAPAALRGRDGARVVVGVAAGERRSAFP